MSADHSIVVTAATGGAAGSIMALVAGYVRDKRKENMIRTRARALVKHELETIRDLIQQRMLDTARSGGDTIPFEDNSIEIQRAERIVEALQYPTMSTEIRLIGFEPKILNELQDVYLLIHTMKAKRAYATEHYFYYYRTDLESWVEDIDNVIQEISTTAAENLNDSKLAKSGKNLAMHAEHLSLRDILQINAAVIAGALVLLTLASTSEISQICNVSVKVFTFSIVSTFSLSAIFAIIGSFFNNARALLMASRAILIIGFLGLIAVTAVIAYNSPFC